MNFDSISGPFTILEFPPFDAIYRTNTDKSRLHYPGPVASLQFQPVFFHQEPQELEPFLPDHLASVCSKFAALMPPIAYDPVIAARVAAEWHQYYSNR